MNAVESGVSSSPVCPVDGYRCLPEVCCKTVDSTAARLLKTAEKVEDWHGKAARTP